jgi:hypothetical protein
MSESLVVARGDEPTGKYLALALGTGLLALVMTVFGIRHALDGGEQLISAGLMGINAVWAAVLSMPFWQIVLVRNDDGDDYLRLDADGVRVRDHGWRLDADWASVRSLAVIERGPDWYRVRIRTTAAAKSSKDPLGRMCRGMLLGKGLVVRFTGPDDPAEQDLAATVARFSGGRVALAGQRVQR